MNIGELLPILSGLLLGSVLRWIRPSLRVRAGLTLSLTLGAVATIATGEFRSSWGFLLVDIPLVAASAAVGFVIVHRLRFCRKAVLVSLFPPFSSPVAREGGRHDRLQRQSF